MPKLFELEGPVPRHVGELPDAAVNYMAQQVRVEAAELASYDWSGGTIKYHRAQIREAYGFREATRSDEDHLAAWLSEDACSVELSEGRLREALLARCRAEHIEPPGRLERILAAAGAAFDKRFCAQVVARLSSASKDAGRRSSATAPMERWRS